MANAIVHTSQKAITRLESLGLSAELLSAVILQADAEASTTTALDPPTAEGVTRYNATVRYLRIELVARGWDYDNAGNFCRTVSPATEFAIVTSSGDLNTGNEVATPSTKYVKGESTAKAVASNKQYAFDLGPEFNLEEGPDLDAIPTWYLLQYVDGVIIHAELSLPSDISGGKISEWSERILLAPIDRSGAPTEIEDVPDADDGAYNVDVVARR